MTDERADVEDRELDPTVEPKSSLAWLNVIKQAEKAFEEYHDKVDNIDKLYANLDRLAQDYREREFQLFWANIQVIGPSIYSRPPVPVVVPRFRDRKPLPKAASELLERSTVVAFEQEDIDHTMRLVRDDLAIAARGVVWARYETKQESDTLSERVCVEHVDRKDFLHDPARKWSEVSWVARRAWLTKPQMSERFESISGEAYHNAEYSVAKEDKENGASDSLAKAGVWEVWDRDRKKVVWVTPGVDVPLDEDEPHLKLEGFFPCPRPAYSTVQRRSLVPVPDMVFYKDQLEEINELTGRIAALSQAIKVRAFYPAGAGDIGDAVEAAVRSVDNNVVMVPISNWAAFGGVGTKDTIVWLPIDMIATVVTQLVELRRQLIDDVYQISGISDIQRGETNPNETLGAQQLKQSNGAVRVRDRQEELVRLSRDVTRIVAEIMAENFQQKTLLDMAQIEMPTDADIKSQLKDLENQGKQASDELEQKVTQAKSDPQMMQQAQENPEQAQQMVQQLQEQFQQQLQGLQAKARKISETVTIDQVMKLLREQRLRPFVLDIETDSTIAPDENAQKQRATEFVTAIGGFLNQAVQGVQLVPEMAPLMADTLKFVAGQFRAGRELDTSIDEFAEKMKEMAGQPKGPDPAQAAAEADAKAKETDAQIKAQQAQQDAQQQQIELQMRAQETSDKAQREELDRQIRAQEAQDAANARALDLQAKATMAQLQLEQQQAKGAADQQEHLQKLDIGALQIDKIKAEIARIGVNTQATIATTQAGIEATEAKTEAGVTAVHAGIEAKHEMAEAKAGAD